MKYEIFNYEGSGYQKVMNFNSWRVAILNYHEDCSLNGINYLEAHEKTDEAFVLLKGQATLIFGEVKDNKIEEFETVVLKPNKVYNVKQGIFHHHVLSIDAKLLIIEEDNTSYENSKRIYFDNNLLKKLKERF